MSVALALIFDWLVGDPERAWHPVAVFGRFATWIEESVYGASRLAGVAAWALTVSAGLAFVAAFLFVAERGGLAMLAGSVVIWMTVGWRSLFEHVAAVSRASDVDSARLAAGRIVGRDVGSMSLVDARRAALESLAENASDAVIAPLFWAAVGGPLAAAAYRWINTLDAMWGYRSARYDRFGWAAARADDVANWIPARVTAALYLLAGRRGLSADLKRQAREHSSPNAGWPEAAMAHVLGVRLGGPVQRASGVEERPWMGSPDAEEPGEGSIELGMRVTCRALGIGATLTVLVCL